MYKEQHISENDAIRIFDVIAHEHELELSIFEHVVSFDQLIFSLTTNNTKFYMHIAYCHPHIHIAKKSCVKFSYHDIKWMEIQVPICDANAFRIKKYTNMFNLVLFSAQFDDVMFYNETGEHVLIKKGTTLEELLIRADLRAS